MRVWALASCSGLLALAACSAEQSSPPDLGTAPPDGNDAVEVNAQPGLRATASSPMARPELRSRLEGLDRARFSPRSPQASPVANRSGGAGQTLPQADQLRARLQRLRTQNGARLSSNTPIATAPLPAALTSTPPRPVPQAAAGEQPSETRPADNTIAIARPGLEPSLRPAGVTALPPLPRPNVAAPELGLSSTTSTAIDLGPVAATNRADSYSVALGRHQGYSTRSQQPTPTITPVATESPERLTARRHGATPVSPVGAPAAVAAQPSPPAADLAEADVLAPTQVETAVPAAAPLVTAPLAAAPLAAAVEVGSTPAAAEFDPATAHQSSATPALTLTPQRVGALAPATLAHHSQGRAARPGTAIAPPESLPLNLGTPRLSPLRSAAVTSPDAALTVPEAAVPQVLEAQPSATQTSETEASEAQTLKFQASSSAVSAHQGQAQPESLSLSPQPEANPKDLPAAYCLQASGLPLSADAQTESDSLDIDQQLDQLSTTLRSGPADAALALGGRLSKAEPSATCLEQSGAVAEPAADDFHPALPLD